MRFFDAFNGDADGLFALHQLRLAQPRDSELVTGVKRDIDLLSRIHPTTEDLVTAIDISLDSNRSDLMRILDSGARVEFFDHHYAGNIPSHPKLKVYIDDSPDTCTSLIVNRFLEQRFAKWAIAGAFGDALVQTAWQKGAEIPLSEQCIILLRKLGELFNYNSYGDSIKDLFYPPESLYRKIEPYSDPFDFIKNSDVLTTLEEGFQSDLQQAERIKAYSRKENSLVFVLPDEIWARRVRGTFAHRLSRKFSECAVAVVLTRSSGIFVVSIRTVERSNLRADEFCRQFPTGGGRARAAGINELPQEQFPEFVNRFHQLFRAQKSFKEVENTKEQNLCKQT